MRRNRSRWVCGKCGKPVEDFMVMVLAFKAPRIGVKMCVPCARKFLAKTRRDSSMKLSKPSYIAWVRGGGPCESKPTLKAAKKAAKQCEARGGVKHDFFRVQKVLR